jgi:lycopene elongase/hydratase (dihydrobisanhydrobacterioruberin-forming)
MVSLLPMLVGYVLASRTLAPGLDLWVGFWAQAASGGASTTQFLDTTTAWVATARPWLLGLVVMGPLLWVPTLLWNDLQDLPGDRQNPRKARSPLVQGIVSADLVRIVSYGSALLAVAVAAAVGIQFAALVVACLLLAWLYSVPPARLKTRPGADVAVNALGVGLLSALAGWSIAAPLGAFPWHFAPQGLLVAIAVYVPTTLVDHQADQAAGYLTLATHLGPRRAYRIGWWAWIACNLGAIALAAANAILPRRMLPILLVFAPLLLYQYHAHIGKARDGPEMVKGIILCSLTFLAVNALFALMYTGMWV